uniref:Uncharacterized protein n=1 Tax=Compsopogon caeruleus TaxID=31354 RepID=A0A7S1XD92_9RHOD|eukprot:CAMPEP_0184685216 /NCGR_PEP_ID=MMETSP0312-20130426/18150_1 /TAXON_ID=31354 /ORGANISM="Compsopogon coeruleus, Strain SAG 36.94" /LENGTH=341 /DNA_ID=CAMNT_0027139095 /DNA_START=17 /DNA_END=1042 /DNA_ORIENTATION=+
MAEEMTDDVRDVPGIGGWGSGRKLYKKEGSMVVDGSHGQVRARQSNHRRGAMALLKGAAAVPMNRLSSAKKERVGSPREMSSPGAHDDPEGSLAELGDMLPESASCAGTVTRKTMNCTSYVEEDDYLVYGSLAEEDSMKRLARYMESVRRENMEEQRDLQGRGRSTVISVEASPILSPKPQREASALGNGLFRMVSTSLPTRTAIDHHTDDFGEEEDSSKRKNVAFSKIRGSVSKLLRSRSEDPKESEDNPTTSEIPLPRHIISSGLDTNIWLTPDLQKEFFGDILDKTRKCLVPWETDTGVKGNDECPTSTPASEVHVESSTCFEDIEDYESVARLEFVR